MIGIPDDTDEPTIDLVRRAQGGDERAKDALASRFLPRLTKWTTGRLPRDFRSMHDTGDLVQDALINALRNLKGFEASETGSFQAYLRRIVVNNVRDLYRRGKRRPGVGEMPEDVPSPAPSPLDDVLSKEKHRWYEHALGTLNDEGQALVFLRFELGFSFQEIAEQLDKPSPDAARVALTRALKQLIKAMTESARGGASRTATGN